MEAMRVLKRGKERTARFTAMFLLVILLGICGSVQAGDKKMKAADFSLKDLKGETVKLSDLYGKGPIIINFWATWCKPCIKELPHLDKIQKDYKEKGVEVLAISEDSPWSVSKVKSFVAGNKYTFTVLLDTNGKVMRKYGLLGTPYTLIISSEGEVVFKHFGYRPGDEVSLREELESALKGEEESTGEKW
jgi:peroxiredoxin